MNFWFSAINDYPFNKDLSGEHALMDVLKHHPEHGKLIEQPGCKVYKVGSKQSWTLKVSSERGLVAVDWEDCVYARFVSQQR
eukprot:52461-Eustigmatos_ZCMA.PRE.1